MRLRTFTASTMREAMAQVRESLGADAVILSTHESKRGRGVQLTDGVDESRSELLPAAPPTVSSLHDELEAPLDYHGVPGDLIRRLVRTADRLNETAGLDADGALVAAIERRIAFEAIEPRPAGRWSWWVRAAPERPRRRRSWRPDPCSPANRSSWSRPIRFVPAPSASCKPSPAYWSSRSPAPRRPRFSAVCWPRRRTAHR